MLFGRDAEQRRIARVLAGARAGRGSALLVRGEAGVGKSALLDWTRAQAEGFGILWAGGVPIESGLPFAGLAALLGPVQDGVERLPAPQAAALRAALSLAPPAGANPFAAYAGVLALLQRAAAARPLLVLADDAHWIDPPSVDGLRFVARRLAAMPVALLLAARDGEGREIEDQDLPELRVHGLSAGAARELLAEREPSLGPAVARSLVERTGGNPLALIEIPKLLTAAQRADVAPLDDPMAPGPTLERVFARRLRHLPADARSAMLVAAASDVPDLATLVRALDGLGLDLRALEPAEAAGLVRLDADRLAFRHPLVRAGVYHVAAPGDRRRAHAALAEALGGERAAARRVFHLAAATAGPAEDVARALQSGAEDAMARGALDHAATGFEQAARLSEDSGRRGARLLAAAQCALLAGSLDRAGALVAAAEPLTADPAHADAVHVRGVLEMVGGDPLAGHAVLVAEADRVEDADPRRAGALLLDAAVAHMETADLEALAATASRARSLLEHAQDPRAALAAVLLAEAWIAMGRPEGAALLAAHEERLHDYDPLGGAQETVAMAAICWGWIEDYDRAERLLGRALAAARDATALRALPVLLVAASQLDVRRGAWSAAETGATEADALARETRQHVIRPYTLHCVAHLDVLRGREAEGRDRLERAREANVARGMVANTYHVDQILGHLELSLGRLPEAITALEAAERIYVGRGGEPGLFQSTPDLVECYARTRQTRRAEAILAGYDGLVAATGRSFGRAAAARCEGLLAPAHAIDEPFERALASHRPGVLPHERARTQLCYGERLRRARRRIDAREQLHGALSAFEQLGAPLWATRAREELAATSEHVRHVEPAWRGPLTSQERRVARLVAGGATNREVAQALFLSTKTVEAHLRHVFRKLDVRSRTGLAARAATGALDDEAGGVSPRG